MKQVLVKTILLSKIIQKLSEFCLHICFRTTLTPICRRSVTDFHLYGYLEEKYAQTSVK